MFYFLLAADGLAEEMLSSIQVGYLRKPRSKILS